ncbi:YhdP family phospholipid transporter [Halomonas alkaliantarctica]|uniref:YhdP family phospholipid transporter n=1 Tax=Halomonas alkaliantarctica TaxID=232346 RepID=UPI003D7D642B
MALRSFSRWCLVVIASLLGSLAVLLLLARLLVSQSSLLTPKIEALLESRVGVPVTIEHLSLSLARNDLVLRLEGVHSTAHDGQPLVSLENAHLRLDGWATLKSVAPVFNDARITGLEFHLYQQDDAAWGWPAPAELPIVMSEEPTVDLAALDAWAGLILRQRLWVDNTRLVLHGSQQDVTLHAPTLLLNGDERRTRLEGAIMILESQGEDSQVAGSPKQEAQEQEAQEQEAQEQEALPAIAMNVEMQPGKQGFRDFSAALQLDMQLDHLVALAAVLRSDSMPALEQAGGEVKLWGRWHAGRLDEARLAVDVPQLTLRHEIQYAVLQNIQANGLWQRDGEGGEAWLSGNAENVEWARPEGGSEGPALPRHWYLTHQPNQWEVRTSAFELASLAAWRDYILLPESLTRVLQTLSPRGQVQGLRLGQQEGHWGVDAALTNVAVLPWEQAPGGGPLDAWVQARDFRGRVTFNSAGGSSLNFPELFESPMQLSHAEGVVEWVYDGPSTMISGRDLRLEWDGAEVVGGFGLIAAKQGGQFGLDIGFENVDALNYPLSQWLPIKILEPELREWLLTDIGGYVSHGSLKLSLPFTGEESSSERQPADQLSSTLALFVTQGRLPIAPEWPMLEEVEGRLIWQDQVLEATIQHAESLGIGVSDGVLKMADERLDLSGSLSGDSDALLAFLQAMPEIDMPLLNDVRAEGSVEGEIALSLPLNAPDLLALEINARPNFSTLAFQPVNIPLENLQGEMTWQQQGEKSALLGQVSGQLSGSSIDADINVPDDGIILSGNIDIAALFQLADIPTEQARQLIEGRTQWRGQINLQPTPSLVLESRLLGITSRLPAPFSKSAEQPWPWRLSADFASGRLATQVADIVNARVQLGSDELAGEVALGGAVAPDNWPTQPGWKVTAHVDELPLDDWQEALSPFMQASSSANGNREGTPISVMVNTPCVHFRDACFGQLAATGSIEGKRLAMQLSGDLVSGRVDYKPDSALPLDIAISSLEVDRLFDMPAAAHDSSAPTPGSWMDAVETQHAATSAIPEWLNQLPNGRLRLADISLGEGRFGPLTAYWQTQDQRFTLSPVGLTLGQLSARGELVWEGNAINSHTRADVSIQGGDVGTALERLGQPVAMRSRTTDVSAALTWPGAPWQFELSRAEGDIRTDVRDGRFVTLESTPARLVGLLNFDNILRRLRFDFSDVTGRGTAFDRVHGTADVAAGQLILRGPLSIEAPSTTLTLTGSVNLIRRELDQRLGVTLPISQSLPIAAIAVGAPIVGGALFIADQLFGNALDQATTIHYRVRGPWTSPQITLEGPQ